MFFRAWELGTSRYEKYGALKYAVEDLALVVLFCTIWDLTLTNQFVLLYKKQLELVVATISLKPYC